MAWNTWEPEWTQQNQVVSVQVLVHTTGVRLAVFFVVFILSGVNIFMILLVILQFYTLTIYHRLETEVKQNYLCLWVITFVPHFVSCAREHQMFPTFTKHCGILWVHHAGTHIFIKLQKMSDFPQRKWLQLQTTQNNFSHLLVALTIFHSYIKSWLDSFDHTHLLERVLVSRNRAAKKRDDSQ